MPHRKLTKGEMLRGAQKALLKTKDPNLRKGLQKLIRRLKK